MRNINKEAPKDDTLNIHLPSGIVFTQFFEKLLAQVTQFLLDSTAISTAYIKMVLNPPVPYIGAHIGLYDPRPENGQTWETETTPPARFEKIRFDAVDILHVGHFMATESGHFSFGTVDNGKASIANRFEYIVKTARAMNPNIKIIAEQMYSNKEGFDKLDKDPAKTATMVEVYANSVRDFLQTWQNKPNVNYKGKSISLHIDGYDVDHEGSTIRECTKDVLSHVRAKLDEPTTQD